MENLSSYFLLLLILIREIFAFLLSNILFKRWDEVSSASLIKHFELKIL